VCLLTKRETTGVIRSVSLLRKGDTTGVIRSCESIDEGGHYRTNQKLRVN
jgi:hypothetical protein